MQPISKGVTYHEEGGPPSRNPASATGESAEFPLTSICTSVLKADLL